MTVEEKMWKMVQLLHDKTSKGEIKWEQIAGKASYQTPFPKYTVRISEIRSDEPEESPDYVVSIFNEEGTLVERASDVTIRDKVQDTQPFLLMKELYTLARRKALGVDDALDDLLADLDVPF